MTVKLELNPDIEAGLLAQARENGMSLEAFAEEPRRAVSRNGRGSEIPRTLLCERTTVV